MNEAVSRPRLCLFYGEDTFSPKEALAALAADLGLAGPGDSNYHLLEGRGLKAADLISLCSTIPFLSAHRLVVVDGLLAWLESQEQGRKGAASRGSEVKDKAGEWRAFEEFVVHMPEQTTLVFVEESLPGGRGTAVHLAALAVKKEFPRLRGGQLQRWIVERVQRTGGAIAPSAARLLGSMMGHDLWGLSQEIEKLSLYAGSKLIQDAQVRALTTAGQEHSIFTLVDAVIERKRSLAVATLYALCREGITPGRILTMLTRQFRLLLEAQELIGEGAKDSEVGKRLRITSDFVLNRLREQLRGCSNAQLLAGYDGLLRADLAIKTGQLNEELALELLVVELCSRVTSASVK